MNIYAKIIVIQVCMLLCAVLEINAKSKVYSSASYTANPEWHINNGVFKLYDTPFGAVYQFALSDYFDFSHIYRNDKRNNVYCIQFDMPSFYINERRKYRFLVLDFNIRTFPAVSKTKTPKLLFSLTRSRSIAKSISAYRNLNGIAPFDSGDLWPGISAPDRSPYLPRREKIRTWSLMCGERYLPSYEPVSCRVIFDSKEGEVVSTNVNGCKYIIRHHEESPKSPYANSLGICVQIHTKTLPRKPTPRKLIEVSKPKITLTNDESYLQELKPLGIAEYPYSQYPEMEKKLIRIKNPDWIYAYAMSLLDGKDPIKAVEALERAAKKEHIFAMYQLGVCYYRGLGVEQDMHKALRWLTRAAEYSMPDAMALLALISMRSCKTVYLFDRNRGLILRGLNLEGTKKHSNRVMSRMFYNVEKPGHFISSPQIAFWAARNAYIMDYYANAVDPKIRPASENVKIEKPWVAWAPEITNKITDFAKEKMIKIPFGFKEPLIKDKIRKKRYPNTRYYDIRVEGFEEAGNGMELLGEAVKQKYLPAVLYTGRLYAEVWGKTQEALEIFEDGEKLGSTACALDALHCRLRLGKLKPEDFTEDQDVKFADYPLYYMLRYMRDNPDAPGVKEFLAKRYEDARQIWRKTPTSWNNFLLGAEALYQYFNYGFDTAYYRIYWEKTGELTKAIEYIDKAAKENIIPAVYLSGKQHVDGVCCRTRMEMKNSAKGVGIELLSRAGKAGHIKAQYLLVKHYFESKHFIDKKWLKQLKPARDADLGDAWMLSTDIYAKLQNFRYSCGKNVVKGYTKAAELGCYRAWDRLARLYYYGKCVPENKEKAEEYWKKFIKCDEKIRSQDLNDFYWPKIKMPVIVTYDKDGLPSPRVTTRQSLAEQKHYFSTY